MNQKRWAGAALAFTLILSSLPLVGAGPGSDDDGDRVTDVRGRDLGRGVREWVFVFPERGGRSPTDGAGVAKCDDHDQLAAVPSFANPKLGGMTFNINQGSLPGDKAAVTQAIRDSLAAWDATDATVTYFTVNGTGGASKASFDGKNSVGFRKMQAGVLAATWVWTSNGAVVQADVFYNSLYRWGVFTTCNAQNAYEVGNVGTHEAGHVLGQNHLSDPGAYATMYPSAAAGEVRKRTLTTGDKDLSI